MGGHNDLATELRDTKWRLQQLETQYDHAVSKSNAQGDAFKLAEEQLEVSCCTEASRTMVCVPMH